MSDIYDLLIVGGGINGCSIAREAALNGWRVMLVEKGDLAGATSSASTKLIHGGLRYLESYDFGLVSEALRERERLLSAAPHIIHPMRFVLPHRNGVRPWWLVRLGLLLYDTIGGRSSLRRSRGLRRSDTAFIAPLKDGARGFVYSDAFVDDARLTLLNAVDAAENGADIRVGTALNGAYRSDGLWQATIGGGQSVRAHAIVNAGGPWVAELFGKFGVDPQSRVRLVKGSHIVVPELYEGDHAYILQLDDRRIIFALPYHGETAIGTTDIPVDRPEDARIGSDEIAYLCRAANAHFKRQISPDDVTSTWSGVRPLYDDGESDAQSVTRDYVLELDGEGDAPLLSVFGGKITTGRHLAEDAIGKLGKTLGRRTAEQTRDRPLPGGAIGDFATFLAEVRAAWPFLGQARSDRMTRAYGSRIAEMLANVAVEADMGERFGAGLTEIELTWMRDREWARSADDALMRRSKLGLALDAAATARVAAWFAAQPAGG